jgi:hypothetical protein
MSKSEQCLYVKYLVRHADGRQVDGITLVLRPNRDYAAVIALRTYAAATPNKALAEDIYNWVGSPDEAKLLTLAELRERDGKAVFIVPLYKPDERCNVQYPQWAILTTEIGFGPEIMGLSLKGGKIVTWRASEYGKTWLAYDKESIVKKAEGKNGYKKP